MSQRSDILRHLKEHGSITPMDALREFGCFRLGARIHELRRDGQPIVPTTEEYNGKRFARYVLYRQQQTEMAI